VCSCENSRSFFNGCRLGHNCRKHVDHRLGRQLAPAGNFLIRVGAHTQTLPYARKALQGAGSSFSRNISRRAEAKAAKSDEASGVGEHCSTKNPDWKSDPWRPHLTAPISCDRLDLHQGASVRCNYLPMGQPISEHVEARAMAQMMRRPSYTNSANH
jgi:hypothetical protein